MDSRLSSTLTVVLYVLFGSLACSSAGFEVSDQVADSASDDVADASAGDSSSVTDSATELDSGTTGESSAPDVMTDTTTQDTATVLPDSAKPDVTSVVDTGECTAGAVKSCECTGTRTCVMGKWGPCENECLPSPSRYICAYAHDGCTETSCLDSHNCTARCGCASSPGSTCALTDPCWGYVCNGFVCPM
ncbi:MAG: hypothetical protein ACXVEF_08425 [Polyangiales bacterium]